MQTILIYIYFFFSFSFFSFLFFSFLFFSLLCFALLLLFQERVSLCTPGCSGTLSIDQPGIELRHPPASASQVLWLKACTTSAQLNAGIPMSVIEVQLQSFKMDSVFGFSFNSMNQCKVFAHLTRVGRVFTGIERNLVNSHLIHSLIHGWCKLIIADFSQEWPGKCPMTHDWGLKSNQVTEFLTLFKWQRSQKWSHYSCVWR